MLVWDLIFVRVIEGKQEIMFIRSYENGIRKDHEIEDQQIIFLNYISAFPNRDISRIKLGLSGHSLYTFYYVEKTFLSMGFLGIMGVSEYNEQNPYDWPETEDIARSIFIDFFQRLRSGKILEVKLAQKYLDWLDEQILGCYEDFLENRKASVIIEKSKTKNLLANTFSTVGNTSPPKNKSDDFSTASMNSLQLLYGEDFNWDSVMRFWELQLINTYGMPLTPIYSLVNGEIENWGTEAEQTTQSLEGMTYSVLKSFVEQQKLYLQNMKCRKPKDKGFEYIIFNNFEISGHFYMLIMNVDNFYPKVDNSIEFLRGDEHLLLEEIASHLKEHTEWFDEFAQLNRDDSRLNVEYLILTECKKIFE